LARAQYIDVVSLEIDRTTVRNDVKVFFGPVLTDGYSRAVAAASDGTSAARYGARNIIIQEDTSSAIDTQAEADTMAAAILADLKDPKAEQSIEMLYYWPVEVTDLHRYSANGVHYNANQDLAVVRIRHVLGGWRWHAAPHRSLTCAGSRRARSTAGSGGPCTARRVPTVIR
jgi:hypothetical protein